MATILVAVYKGAPRAALARAASASHPSQLPHLHLRTSTPASSRDRSESLLEANKQSDMPAPSDILSDPDINKAYEDVRSDKSETTWLVLKYESATKDNLKLAGSGTGNIAEMVETLGDDEAAYGYVRMTLGNDEYSERVKFVFVVWAGPNTKIMRKAKMSFQSGQVKQVIRTYAVEIQTGDKKELEADQVTMKLRKAMGANYDRQTTTY